MVCNECYYCSKCKTNVAIARGGLKVDGKVVYEKSICETCIRELIKCEECNNSAVKPDGTIRTKQVNRQTIRVCETHSQAQKHEYCKSCDKEYNREQSNEAFYYIVNVELSVDAIQLDGILCSSCWNKEEESYRKITGGFSGFRIKPKTKAVRKEHVKEGILSFIVYNLNTGKWMYILDAEKVDLGSPDNQQTRQQQSTLRNEYLCEGCGKSRWKDRGYNGAGYYTTILRFFDFNFNEEVHYFSDGNCSCAEEFKKTKQQTCAQCSKREWPDMKKGWSLDYGLKKIFCSPKCHMIFHKNQWEQEQREKHRDKRLFNQSYTPGDIPNTVVQSWVENTELYPMELELSSSDKKDFDWEKEALKKEVLILKEMSSPEGLADKSFVQPKDAPKFTYKAEAEEWEQAGKYAELMAQNSFQKAKESYENKYGKAELNALLTGSNQAQQPKKNYWPLVIGIGLVGAGVIAGLIYYFWNKKKSP